MASSSSGDSARRYHVFLSFCGQDTRNSFTDHLYRELTRVGIHTFRDNDEMNKGEELQPEFTKAIEESKGSIVVLSKNYATSTWCLDELALILEKKSKGDHFVLPIFYGVEPTDIRNQRGNFSIQVKPSTSKWTAENVSKWKNALVKVVNLGGEEVSGPETSFLSKFVDVVYNKLDLKEVSLPPNIVGLARHEKEINSWLDQCNLQVLVIYGMDGSGKTTLAQHVYDLNLKKFESVSFLKVHNGLAELQEQLLKDISCGKNRKVPDVSRGMPMIEMALQKNKALIVLDDVTDRKQLVALLGTGNINPKSKIIVTTRENTDGWFDSSCWRCQKYKMKLLSDDESTELFCYHAFRSKKPTADFEEIVQRAIRYCEGHPMALEQLGSSLPMSDAKVWASQLRSWEKDIDCRIQEILIIGYKALPSDTVRELFLHIACFFIGIDMDYVGEILEPDYSAISGIQTLIHKGLLSVSPNKKLMMHRLFQEMGKNIVRQESTKLPARRSRVWLSSDSYNILRKGKGSETVEGLALDMKMLSLQKDFAFKSSGLKTDALKNMEILKLLQLNFVELSGSYEKFSEDLRWLCWIGFQLTTIPSDLYMRNLVAIDMSYSNLEVFEPPTVIDSLRILNLKDSPKLTEIRGIIRIQKLETLILWNCYSLVHVGENLGDLSNLSLLNTTGCKTLYSWGHTNKPTISFPFSLTRLFLKDCHLECTDFFPLGFNSQLDLQYLNLGNSLFEYLPSYNHLENLRVLDLSFCSRLCCLVSLPSTLAELYVYGCELLKTITFKSHRFNLQEFGYLGCIHLREVEGFMKLVPIAKLNETDLGHMNWLKEYKRHEVRLVGDDELTVGRNMHIQILYEFDIMSTSLPDIKDPNLAPNYESESSSLSFNVPSCPKNRRLKGINVTFKYAMFGDDWAWFCKVSTSNGIVDLMYNPIVFGKPEVGEVCTWLSYWPIGSTLDTGDTVSVSIVVLNGLEVHDCGVSLVYSDQEFMENNTGSGWEETLGGDLSGFQLSTRAYYLCRRDFFDLMEVGRLTPDWLRILVDDSIDYTEIRGWRKTGRPKQVNVPSFTEIKSVRCIIHGPQLEDIYKIAEMSKPSFGDKAVAFTSSLIYGKPYKSDGIMIDESNPYSLGREKRTEVERESVKLSLTNELIKAACTLSMKAHSNQYYLTSNHQGGAASSASSIEVLIIAFKGSMEVDEIYQDDHFGETDVDCNMFPSLQRIGKGQLAKVNRSVLLIFQDLWNKSLFKAEVEEAVNEGKKILFSGHSYGGAIASLATLWMLDEYTRKRKIRLPIGCVTFGSPLIGDGTLTHAVRREKWAGHFTHFVMQHDIVTRIMLAPKASIRDHLPSISQFFQHKVSPITTQKTHKFLPENFRKKTPVGTIDFDQMVDDNQAIDFFENVLINASTVASHDAFDFMEPSNSIKEKLSVDFVKVSPYRPFGIYVFCTIGEELGPSTPRQQLVVENPNVVLQLLFYFLQLPNEDQDLAEFALQSLTENFGYEEELNKNGLQLEEMVNLKDLNQHLLTSQGTTSDVVRTRNKALFELTASAKWCLLAVEEAEKRKKENEDQIKENMRLYKSNQPNKRPKIIEDLISEILEYKRKHDDGQIDYYEAFKLQNEDGDFRANVNRLEQAMIWDVVVEMLMRKDLPDEFEVWDELVDLATRLRRLYEPLEIANYYRHMKGDDIALAYLRVRPRRYKFIQRWYEHANATGFEVVSESNFVAEVEELIKKIIKPNKKTFEEVNKGFESLKNEVGKWQSDDKIAYEDVYWGDSILSKLQEKLALGC